MADEATAQGDGMSYATRRSGGRRRRWLVVSATVVVLLLVPASCAYWFIQRPYEHSEERLRAEVRAWRYNPGVLVSDDFEDGVCLDNCPALVLTFRTRGSSCSALTRAASALRKRGYRVVGTEASFSAKGREHYVVSAIAGGHECQSSFNRSGLAADQLRVDVGYST